MKDYSRDIARLVRRIPTDLECEPGCHDCCALHAWTWTEWAKLPMDMRKVAVNKTDPCPFITEAGCECYEYRPVICRLWGYAENIGPYGPYPDVTLRCKRGLRSASQLSHKEARDIFIGNQTIIRNEGIDAANDGLGTLFAGPYGRWVGERREMK